MKPQVLPCEASGVALWTLTLSSGPGVQLVSFKDNLPFVTNALVDIHQSLVATVAVLPSRLRHRKDHSGLLQF